MSLPIDIATANVQAQIDAAPDCSTVRVTERILGRLVIEGRRKLTLMPVETIGECYLQELLIKNSKDCVAEKFTMTANKDPLKPVGLQIVWDGGPGHNALNNVIRRFEFKQYQYGAAVGALPDVGPPGNQWSTAYNRFEDCVFENCGTGLLINSANAQGTVTQDCVFIGNGTAVHNKLGQYLDLRSTFLVNTVCDVHISDAVLPTRMDGSYTEQSARFMLIDGPTLSGWPTTLTACSIVGSGSPFTKAGETAPWAAGRHFAIVNQGAQLLLQGCVVGITNTPLYIAVGGGQTSLCDVTGSQFFTEGQEFPIIGLNGTMTVNGQCLVRDPAQLQYPKPLTRHSLVNAQVNVISTPDNPDQFRSTRFRKGPWAAGDDSGDFVSEVREDGETMLVYDARTTGIAQRTLLGLLSSPPIV